MAGDDHDSFVFSGDQTFVGSNIGGRGNIAYGMAQINAGPEELAADLARLIPELLATADGDQSMLRDVERVRQAHELVAAGDPTQAVARLRKVGSWVARIAESVGAKVVATIITDAI